LHLFVYLVDCYIVSKIGGLTKLNPLKLLIVNLSKN